MKGIYAVIRIRGIPGHRPKVKRTLKALILHRNFNAVLVKGDESSDQMLKTVESVVTWGEVNKETLAKLLKKRGRCTGNKRLTPDLLEQLGYRSFEEMADSIIRLDLDIRDVSGLKPVFRLTPPSGGFKGSIKRHFGIRGVFGYRGEKINDLLLRMM